MHFIGMLAFLLPMPVSYDFGLTLLSLLLAIGVTGFGFFMIGTRRVTTLEFVVSGVFMGIGIAAMHYTGMAALRMPAYIRYDRVLVALSVLIAIGASIPALWLAFRTTLAWQRLLAAAVVMGSAISGMHYTGMAAATFIAAPGTDGTRGVPALAQTDLALAIATITFVILLLALVASAFDRKLTRLAERETALLRENEERLRNLYRETPLPLHAVGLDGRIEKVSDAWLRLLGYPREDTTGRDLTDFMTEDSKQRYDEIVWPRLQLGDDVQEVECRFVRKSGEVLDVLLNAHQERADEKPVRMLGGIVDITARKRAESRLAEREAQLELFIEHAPAAIAMFDDKMRYLAVSSRFLSDYKLPAAEIIGRSHYEIFPDIPRRWRELHARVLTGEELGHEEDPFPRQDGRVERVQWSMKPWRTADGRIGGALLFSQFVTGILAESEARFRATFENAAVGIAHVAPDGRLLRVNKALCRILGYSADELITRSFQDISHPDDLAANLAEIKGILDGKIDSYRMDKRCLRKDGSVVWARLTVGGVRKSEGSIDYLVSVVEDISARKQAEQALQASKDRLQFALDAALLGWWQYDPLHRVVSGDARCQEIFDFTEPAAPIEEVMMRVHPDDGERVWAAIDAAIDPIDPRRTATTFRFRRRDGEVRWAETSGLGYFEGIGRERRAVNLVGTIADITERKEREEKEHLLMREINHRAKNMLSVVDAIAHQTAARNPEDFIERFSERIQALSANQDLLVRNEWKGVDIDDLVHAQLAHFADLIGSRIGLQGPRLYLNPAAVQAIGLALHELSTNTAKYGALLTDRGHVDVCWGSDGDTFTMTWTERDGPLSPPKQRGFGTIVMEAMAERTVGGKVELDYAPTGVTWRLTCPAANVLERR